MTPHFYSIRAHPRRLGPFVLNAALCGALIWWLTACTPGGGLTPQGQQTVNVICDRDAALQPVVVPIVLMASAAAGPAAPAVAGAATLDQVLLHPAVVAACAAYHSKPGAVVAVAPPGATVAAPVPVAVKPGA